MKNKQGNKMKKLIIALAVLFAAVVTQAASVSWNTAALYKPDGSGKVGKAVTEYVYLITAEQYAGTSTAWELAGEDVLAGGSNKSAGATTGQYNHFASAKTTSVADTTYYAAVIVTYGTGDNMKYMAEKATVTTGNDGNGSITLFDAAKTAEGAKAAWQSVPEPTSAMLMLLGMAGLALRRRRA